MIGADPVSQYYLLGRVFYGHNLHNARWKRFILAEQVRELITEGLDDIGLSETNKIAIRQLFLLPRRLYLVRNSCKEHYVCSQVGPLEFRRKVVVLPEFTQVS